ncbi:MAG: glycosyl transferase [Desulfuromonas sp.]|nr:MAG: glycosyl transferase [Desulfuromonas sp.]
MKTPAISILMAVRNEEEHLQAAVDSIRRQTLSDWEMIIVDDGSTDATPAILEDAARNDSRIKILRQEPLGLVTALCKGMQQCRSDYIARMDGDDICHPRRLEKQWAHLENHPGLALVATNIRYFPSHQVRGGMRHYEIWQNGLVNDDLIRRDLFVESPFTQPSVMFRKNAVVAVGGYQENSWGEDYDLWLRLALAGYRFARIPETLFFWREHGNRLTHLAEEFTLNAFRRCKAHYLKQSYLKDYDTVTLWGSGLEGKEWRKTLEKLKITVHRWIDIDPRKIGQTIHGAKVEDPDVLKPGSGPMLITIGVRGARELVRQKSAELGLVEGVDYVCVT